MASPNGNVFIRFMADPKNIGRLCELVDEVPNIEFSTMGGHVFWNTLAEEQGYKKWAPNLDNKIGCRLPWRYICLVIFLAMVTYWLIAGWLITERLTQFTASDQAVATISAIMDDNPQLVTTLARDRDRYGDQSVPVKLVLTHINSQRYMGSSRFIVI